MTNDDFKNHLQSIVDGRMEILNNKALDDEAKKISLSIYDKENDELNQSIDIFFRLMDYEGFLQYTSLLDSKADLEVVNSQLFHKASAEDTSVALGVRPTLTTVKTLLNTKADLETVNQDLETVNQALDTKADLETVNQDLETVNQALDTKANSESVNFALNSRPTLSFVEGLLSNKVDFNFSNFKTFNFVRSPINFSFNLETSTKDLLLYSFDFTLDTDSFITYSPLFVVKHRGVYSRISFLIDDVENHFTRIPRLQNDYATVDFSQFTFLSAGTHTFKILLDVHSAEDTPSLLLDLWDVSVKINTFPLVR